MKNSQALEIAESVFADAIKRRLVGGDYEEQALKTIRAALATPVGWRPIESAPKDGRIAVFYRPLAHLSNDPHVAVKRTCKTPQHVWEATIPEGCDGLNYNDGFCYATHWMPLPATPHTEERG